MGMHARYEEKTFESYFNNELDQKTSIYFPLGQVQEGILGLDSVAHSRSRSLWRLLGYPFWRSPPFSGVNVQDIAEEMERHLGAEVHNVPAMKVNLLFQYKRPDFIIRASGAEWSLWNQQYFRYSLYDEQHALLSHIDATFGRDAIVLYAAPAARDVNDLINFKKKGVIIENTNFRRAYELNGHRRNTYIAAAGSGDSLLNSGSRDGVKFVLGAACAAALAADGGTTICPDDTTKPVSSCGNGWTVGWPIAQSHWNQGESSAVCQ